jgi:hypothetical protein
MTMRLVPYAGTERPRPRPLREKDRRAALLAKIMVRQRQGRLLSEIGAEFGSHIMVRSVVLVWLFEMPP